MTVFHPLRAICVSIGWIAALFALIGFVKPFSPFDAPWYWLAVLYLCLIVEMQRQGNRENAGFAIISGVALALLRVIYRWRWTEQSPINAWIAVAAISFVFALTTLMVITSYVNLTDILVALRLYREDEDGPFPPPGMPD